MISSRSILHPIPSCAGQSPSHDTFLLCARTGLNDQQVLRSTNSRPTRHGHRIVHSFAFFVTVTIRAVRFAASLRPLTYSFSLSKSLSP